MMRNYNQLTCDQRCQIEALKKSRLSQKKMAESIGCTQSTISRELKRNSQSNKYDFKQADKLTLQRRQHKAVRKMVPDFIDFIEDKLTQNWSPAQLSGWLENNPDEAQGRRISHERIYQHIWQDKKNGGELYRCLRRAGKAYQSRGSSGKTSRGQIRNRVSIDERPAHVEERLEFGHWEIDTMIGKGHSGALVTIVERKTRFTLSRRVSSKCADDVTMATLALLRPYADQVLSITADNGKEFAYHEKITKALKCDFYFAHPYHSWERGTNENTNGLLRQYFPKSTDFKTVKQQEVISAVEQLNQRPRKVLNFETPEALMQHYRAECAN